MKSLIVTALLLTSTAAFSADQAQKQAIIECLSQADSAYKNAWARQCPTGPGIYQHNYPLCSLPRYEALGLSNDLRAAQNDCYQMNAAGLFTLDEPIDMRPQSDPADNILPPEAEPRRKFWMSPQ